MARQGEYNRSGVARSAAQPSPPGTVTHSCRLSSLRQMVSAVHAAGLVIWWYRRRPAGDFNEYAERRDSADRASFAAKEMEMDIACFALLEAQGPVEA